MHCSENKLFFFFSIFKSLKFEMLMNHGWRISTINLFLCWFNFHFFPFIFLASVFSSFLQYCSFALCEIPSSLVWVLPLPDHVTFLLSGKGKRFPGFTAPCSSYLARDYSKFIEIILLAIFCSLTFNLVAFSVVCLCCSQFSQPFVRYFISSTGIDNLFCYCALCTCTTNVSISHQDINYYSPFFVHIVRSFNGVYLVNCSIRINK